MPEYNKQSGQTQQDEIDLSIICQSLMGKKRKFNISIVLISLIILLILGIKYIPLLHTLSIKYQFYCHHEDIRSNLFYVDVDIQGITQKQRQLFNTQNIVCNITIINSSMLPSYIQIWNQMQSEQFGNKDYIQTKQEYSSNDQKLILILLHMYYNGQTYLYPTELLYNMQPKCLWRLYHGSQLMFNKIDHYDQQKNIYIPSRQFTMLKVGYKNNWMIRRLIKSIIKGEDLLTVCKGYQCAIMDCDKHIKE